MRSKIEKIVEKMDGMYFTDSPINVDHDYKYFLCFTNTHSVACKANTLQEMYDKVLEFRRYLMICRIETKK